MVNSQVAKITRRRQVRVKAKNKKGPYRGWLLRVFSWPVLACGLFALAAMGISLLGSDRLPYTVGERLDQPLYSRVGFSIVSQTRTAEARTTARRNTASYYRHRPDLLVDRVQEGLLRLLDRALEADSLSTLQTALADRAYVITEEAFAKLKELSDDDGRTLYNNWIQKLPLNSEYVATSWDQELRSPPSFQNHILILPAQENEGSKSDTVMSSPSVKPKQVSRTSRALVTQTQVDDIQKRAENLARVFPHELQATVASVIADAMRHQPTITFDQKKTASAMDDAAAAVEPVVETFAKGQPFINPHASGGELVLTNDHFDLLLAENKAYNNFLRGQHENPEDDALAAQLRQESLLREVGMVGTMLFLSIALFLYARVYQPRILKVRTRTMATMGLLLATLLAARLLALKWPAWPEFMFTPVFFCASVLAVLYPSRFNIGVLGAMVLLLAAILGQDIAFMLALMSGLGVTVFLLSDIRSRTRVISAGVCAGVVTGVMTGIGSLAGGQVFGYVWQHAAVGAGAALAAAFLFSSLLPYIEQACRVATALSLLEWRDPTQPLLQLLAQEAPGTYNHSLVLSNLVEAACERIGANGLLAQVGALYHDIGKIYKPHYFTENQAGRINRHENLSPTMSLLIILAHVKDGLEMAKEYKLPRALHRFIAEHHGTTVVRYFHHVASEKQPQIASGKHDREVAEAEFRYPGPKPRTKETAILMVADSVEGAVRSLNEPTAGRIESLVHQIVTDRLNDGQFDECDITLREISQIEESITKSLCSIYHGRVAYPKARKPEDEPRKPAESQPQREVG